MSDIGLFLENNCFDLGFENGDLKADDGLETAVVISLFTERRVTDEQLPQLETNKRGWWGDMFPEVDQDKIGSRLWTIERAKRVTETLRQAEEFSKEALDWMIEDVVAESIAVVAIFDENNFLELTVNISRPDDDDARFSVVWDKQEIRRVS